MKTTSRELSEALKAAGAKQESEKVLVERIIYGTVEVLSRKQFIRSVDCYYLICATFDCHELWTRLPGTIDEPSSYWNLEVGKGKRGNSAGYVKEYWQDTGKQKPDSSQLQGMQLESTLVEALGELRLWCLREGHCGE